MNTSTFPFRTVAARIAGVALVVSLLLGMTLMGGFAQTTLAAPDATITVTNLNDSGAGSLRQAIADAAAGDTIDFSVSGTITLASELVIDKDLTIDGSGNITVSGNNAIRVFKVTSGNVTFDSLTIANGNRQYTDNDPDCGTGTCGGGIAAFNSSVTINNSTIRDNTVASTGFFSTSDKGGGIFMSSTSTSMTVNNSTIANNSTDHGGGIYVAGITAHIDNSTISGNEATTGYGGGVDNVAGTTTISNSTITDNTATRAAGGCGLMSFGGGAQASLQNTIVSGNNCGANAKDVDVLSGGAVTSNGYNLIGTDSSGAFTQTGDQLGVTNPMLDPLAENGGPTQTHALQTGSPAIDAIPDGTNGCAAGASTDQRSAVRADGTNRGGAACEIGAYEYDSLQQPNAITLQAISAANTTTPTIWLVAALLAGFATLVGVFVLRKRSL